MFLTEALYDYMRSVSLRDWDILARLREETSRYPMAGMQISPEQGKFKSLLVRLMGATKTLEVGVFTGYSSLSVALALPPHGKLIACDINEEWTNVAKRYWEEAGVSSKIDLHLAPAIETMDRLIGEGQNDSFDFVFIDADKKNYDGYYERALTLLQPGRLIAIDNVFWHGNVADPKTADADTLSIRSLNEKLYQDDRIELSMIPIGDGLTLALKR